MDIVEQSKKLFDSMSKIAQENEKINTSEPVNMLESDEEQFQRKLRERDEFQKKFDTDLFMLRVLQKDVELLCNSIYGHDFSEDKFNQKCVNCGKVNDRESDEYDEAFEDYL